MNLTKSKKLRKMNKKTKRNKSNNRNSRKHILRRGNQTVTILGEEHDIETTISLELDNNNLISLPESIDNLINLTDLDLSNNQLSSLPRNIRSLKKLTNLNLSNNELDYLSRNIISLTNLTNLNLSGNQLKTLPPTIEKLTKLKELNLSDNQLSTIPKNIEKLSNLEKLNLVHNNISYPLPSKIGNLTLVHTNGIYQLIEGKEECLNFNKEEIEESILNDLNRQIKNKCPELSIELNYYYRLPGRLYTYVDYESIDYNDYDYSKTKTIVLCLYYRGECISSITLTYDGEETMYIDSYTKEDKQGKKYNKLLRCIVIIICSQLSCNSNRRIMSIISEAANPISAWLLINNFETEIEDIEYQKLIKEKNEYNKVTRQDISNLYQTGTILTLSIKIPLNRNNINRAYQLINILLTDISTSIICPS